MLRLATGSRSYDVTVKIAGETTKMKFKSLTLVERLELIEVITGAPVTTEGIKKLAEDLDRVILSIEGHEGKPSEVLLQLEHRGDIDDLCTQVYRWLNLSEQEAKNLDSSPVSSDPNRESTGSVEKDAGPESDPASTNETDLATTDR